MSDIPEHWKQARKDASMKGIQLFRNTDGEAFPWSATYKDMYVGMGYDPSEALESLYIRLHKEIATMMDLSTAITGMLKRYWDAEAEYQQEMEDATK